MITPLRSRGVLAVGLLVVVAVLFVPQQAIQTLYALDRVERERDRWQWSDVILDKLAMRPGQTVVDLGSGAGYFALKIAQRVGPGGRVLAIELRRQSLAFLWIRSRRAGLWNLKVILDEVNDPLLPPGPIDGALIANTSHELATPEAVLNALFAAMRSGGTLVVVERAAHGDADARGHHEIDATTAESAIRQRGFEPVSRDEHFIDRATEDDHWWLIVFRKP